MPAIIVQSNGSTEQDTNVLLYEDVQPEHLASDHHAAQLIERVGLGFAQHAHRESFEVAPPLGQAVFRAGRWQSAVPSSRGRTLRP